MSTNESEEPLLEETEFSRPLGLTGLQNLGNTCYMNAGLQALSNCPQLTGFMLDCQSYVKKPGLATAFLRLVKEMWSEKRPSYVVPSGISQGIKKVCPSFKGYSQQDAQEFLRCLLDQLHEELKEPVIPSQEDRRDRSRKRIRRRRGSSREEDADNPESGSNCSTDDGDYETCDSGLSWERSSIAIDQHSKGNTVLNSGSLDCCDCDSSQKSPEEAESGMFSMNAPKVLEESCLHSVTSGVTANNSHSMMGTSKKKTQYRSVISDIFDGKLLSSVQCLTCDNVSAVKETFQDLSLSIPTREQLNVLRASRKSMESESGRSSPVSLQGSISSSTSSQETYSWIWNWIEWIFGLFWGPTVALEDCLSAFFSADELKGDNMYSCEKCKKLRNGIKFSKVIELPDVLCIHLKRFRHELMFSSKISSQVTFPLEGLDMSPYFINTEEQSTSNSSHEEKITTYDLVSVICHHGTPASGHYTAYCLNSFSDTWYEFDDQYVTAVDPHQVAACEAYVLFYRKNNDQVCQQRLRTVQLIERALEESAQEEYYVSNQWINRFNTFAEPGPISNYDFLCEHGLVQPSKASSAKDLCTVFPKEIWQYMISKYGGGPACTSLDSCLLCSDSIKNEMLKRFNTLFPGSQATLTRMSPNRYPVMTAPSDDSAVISSSSPTLVQMDFNGECNHHVSEDEQPKSMDVTEEEHLIPSFYERRTESMEPQQEVSSSNLSSNLMDLGDNEVVTCNRKAVQCPPIPSADSTQEP